MSSTETDTTEMSGLENVSATPATSIEEDLHEQGKDQVGSDSAELNGNIDKVEDDTNDEEVGTPRNIDTEPISLEDQLQKLTAKLREIEVQTEKDRLNYAKLGEQFQEPYSEMRMPIPFPVDGDEVEPPRRRRYEEEIRYRDRTRDPYEYERSHSRSRVFDSRDSRRLGRHRREMMLMYQRQLSYLEREERMVDGLMEEQQRLKEEAYNLRMTSRRRRRSRSRSRSSTVSVSVAGTVSPFREEVVEREIVYEQTAIPQPPFAISDYKYFEWPTFRGLPTMSLGESECFAFDVLKGEPVLEWNPYASYGYSRRSFRHKQPLFPKVTENLAERKPPAVVASKKQQQSIPGQAQLPERIRINSRHILKVLMTIVGDNLSNSQWDPVVMIRPYKTLVYYHDQIKQRVQDLEAKYVVTDNSSEETEEPEGRPATVDENGEPEQVKEKTEDHNEVRSEEIATDTVPIIIRERRSTQDTIYVDSRDRIERRERVEEDEDETSIIALHHLRVLDKFMNLEIQTKINYLKEDICKTISFNDLWYLFTPGDEVIDQRIRQAYRVLSVNSTSHKVIPPFKTSWGRDSMKAEETPVILKCVYIDFDGKELGPISTTIEIPRYEGERDITKLEVFPLRFAKHPKIEGKDALRNSLIARGKRFLEVACVKHMQYYGNALETKEEIDSQVVVDFEEALSSQKKKHLEGEGEDWTPQLELLIDPPSQERERERVQDGCVYDCCSGEKIHEDADSERKRNEEYISSLRPEDRNKDPSVVIYPRALNVTAPELGITEDELVIMSYRVFGFVLRSRKWAKLDLTYLKPFGYHRKKETNKNTHGVGERKVEGEEENVEENKKLEQSQKTAFEELVLPEGHKDMVVSLISQHFRDKESVTADEDQNDIVRGKGKGLIILLHGLPGVGKTTTAEGVAELFKKPLFQITCGDLGTTASDVENALEKHFALASRWGCILLLDEADVFLAARTPQDFIRNGLVAVFLRVLEYYTGILFLTTNRIGDFDEAFASRIHISLHYPELELESTKEIFRLNLRLIKERRKVSFDEKAILEFAEKYWTNNKQMRWNGRQIRNACQTALALAEFEAQGKSHEFIKLPNAEVEFTVKHLKIVSKAYMDFIIYLKKIYGQSGERRAKAMGLRAREGEVKNQEDDEDEEDDFEKPERSKSAPITPHQTTPPKILPPVEPAAIPAPAQPAYPYGPPPPQWPAGYPPGYHYPPQPYGPPPNGWPQQPPPGAPPYPPNDPAAGH